MSKPEKPIIQDNDLKISEASPTYYKKEFSMTFISEDNIQVHTPVSCRDYLHDIIRASINGKRLASDGHPYFPASTKVNICMDKLLLQLTLSGQTKEKNSFGFGLSVLNHIESNAGVKKTTGEMVYHKNNEASILLCGEDIYMKNPHLLSLVTLVMRFCTLNEEFKYTRFGDLATACKYSTKDSYCMGRCCDWLELILKKHINIFSDKTLGSLFPIEAQETFHSSGGIVALCNENTYNGDVNKRIKKLKMNR